MTNLPQFAPEQAKQTIVQIVEPQWITQEWLNTLQNQQIVKSAELRLSEDTSRNYLGKDQKTFDRIPKDKLDLTILRKIRKGFVDKYSSSMLPQDVLPELYPNLEISPKESAEISKFLALDMIGNNNPTNLKIIKQILDSMRSQTPLELTLSYCISKNPKVRINKLRSFFGADKLGDFEEIDGYFAGIEVKGIEKLKEFAKNSNFGLRLNFILGDMDFWTLDNAQSWISEQNRLKSESEVNQLLKDFRKSIQTQIPEVQISCSKWSEKYNLEEFRLEYQKANNTSEQWLTNELLNQSIYPYYQFWRYEQLQNELNLTRAQMRDFIKQDLIKTAAQYRLEANKIPINNIVLWTESVANPIWPLVISDYDESGIPPSINII